MSLQPAESRRATTASGPALTSGGLAPPPEARATRRAVPVRMVSGPAFAATMPVRSRPVRVPGAGTLGARALFQVRRAVQLSFGFGVVALFAVLLWRGQVPDLRAPAADFSRTAAGVVLTAVLAGKIAGRVRTAVRRRSPLREAFADVEVGLLLLVATYVLLGASGGHASPVYPLVYALVSFLVTFHRLPVGLLLAGSAVGFDALVSFGPGAAPGAAAAFAGHAGFLAVFALLNVVFLHAEVARQRREHRKRLEREVAVMREEARDFRLISTALPPESRVRSRAEEEEKLSQGSIETIREQLFHTLDLLKRSLGLQTCALFWLDSSGERLKLKELVTDAAHVSEEPLSAQGGAPGAVLKDGHTLTLRHPRPALLTYYRGPVDVAAFVGVPVLEKQTLRGLLVADRRDERMFDGAEIALLETATAQIVRIVQSERVFQSVERAKHEHEQLYRASQALASAVKLADVYEAAIAGARGVCEFDLAVLATWDETLGAHTIRRAVGEGGEGMVGATHKDPTSVASMVVKNRHALQWRERDVPVYSRDERLRDFPSLIVLPLLAGEDVVGTFMVAARRPQAFASEKREVLGIIANQMAVAIQNGTMVQVLEDQATTDGLTGLCNHRTFQERLSGMLKRAERIGRNVSLILTDIDHFKKVNDTYGHPTGDEVLRRVAAILKASARDIDIVARYGGEEFAIVLEGTDRVGAKQLAERIRVEVSKQSFASPKGPFSSTLSLGITTYPLDAHDKGELIARADKSLYAAKHSGRNRAMTWPEAEKAKPSAAG